MALPESFLDELLARNDAESVISSYVSLRRRGRTMVGLCPFHGEKTPSFTVYPENNSFYCFGCGAGGDVITFIKKIENLDYIDAVKFLAERSGMRMPELSRGDDVLSRLRLRILEANREAARLYHAVLYSSEGRAGLDYFHSRGYTDQTIRRFGLGYCPGFGTTRDALMRKGFTEEELTAAFLCRRKEAHCYDIFHHRVIVPIIDVRGNVIAFGGRVLDDSKPKYLNSADTPVFHKSGQLFALNFAKAEAGSGLILCEGYMDVIALHQAGFRNAVAALGTAFTAEHAALLSRYTQEVTLIFDSDEAGQKAAQRAIGILRPTGLQVRLTAVPDGKDPDEFIRRNGPERFKLLLSRSANDVEYRLMTIGRQYDLATANGRVGYLGEAAKLLATLHNPIEQDVYAGKLAQELSVSKPSILAQVAQEQKRRERRQQVKTELRQAARQQEQERRRANPEAELHPKAANAEEALLGILILHPDYIRRVRESLPPDYMVTEFNRRLYRLLLERMDQGLTISLPVLTAGMEEEEAAYVTRMVVLRRELEARPEEALCYAEILREEHEQQAVAHPEDMSPEQLMHFIQKKWNTEQGGHSHE